ncbi:MAG: HNH endonuclease [Nitrosopumilus sp.]
MITQKLLKELTVYNEETGDFTNRKTGRVLGCLDKSHGYIITQISGHRGYIHRFAFLYMKGAMPKYVDHKDRNRANNSWSNLRECTQSQNSANMGIAKNNTSGYKGVFYEKRNGTWYSRLYIASKAIQLGSFGTKEEAAEAYNVAATANFGEFAYLNIIPS